MSDEQIRILVSDDDPSARRIVAAMLGHWDCEAIQPIEPREQRRFSSSIRMGWRPLPRCTSDYAPLVAGGLAIC